MGDLKVIKDENLALTKNGLFNVNIIKASPIGALDVRFNGKGLNSDNKPEFLTVQGMPLKDGKGELLKEIDITIFAYQLIDCSDIVLFGKDHAKVTYWCELLFINENNAVCSIFIKGHSLDNLKKYFLSLQLLSEEVKQISEVVTTMKVLEIKSETYGLYYILDFEESKDNLQSDELSSEINELFLTDNEIGTKIIDSAQRYPNKVKIIKRSDLK